MLFAVDVDAAVFPLEAAAEEADDLSRFAAALEDRGGGERRRVSVSEFPASGKSFERKSAQSSGDFSLNLKCACAALWSVSTLPRAATAAE